jgi:hypothetical protein
MERVPWQERAPERRHLEQEPQLWLASALGHSLAEHELGRLRLRYRRLLLLSDWDYCREHCWKMT